MKRVEANHVLLWLVLLALIPLSACGGGGDSAGPGGQQNAPSSIMVLADSSLKDVFTKMGQQFETQNPGETVAFTYGDSDALAQKAAAGDPGDVLATSNTQAMNAAQQAQLDSPDQFATKGSAVYQIVTLKQSKNVSLAQQFITLVTGQVGAQILLQAGFKP